MVGDGQSEVPDAEKFREKPSAVSVVLEGV